MRIFLLTTALIAHTIVAQAVQQPLGEAEKFVLFDFEQPVLHDKAWLASQSNGTNGLFVQPKTGSSNSVLSLAVGKGRNGGNAMLSETLQASDGLPNFWIIKGQTKNNAVSRLYTKEGYMLPSGNRANRLEFWLKFEQGLRSSSSAAQPPKYPNHNNYVIGTYHFDPALIGTGKAVVESNNWHYYHQIWLRHDKAADGWIHVVVNEQPQHIRGRKSALPNNPTAPYGDYFEILTRLYFDLTPYYSDPEKSYPIKMYVDDIALSYVDTSNGITVDMPGYSKGVVIAQDSSKTVTYPVKVTNTSGNRICGKLSAQAPSWLQPKLTNISSTDVCLDPNTAVTADLQITPDGTHLNRNFHAGVTFIQDRYLVSSAMTSSTSLSDTNVERRWVPNLGGHDAVSKSFFVRVLVLDTTPTPTPTPTPAVITAEQLRNFITLQERILKQLLGL